MTDKFKNMVKEDIEKCAEMSDVDMASDLYYGKDAILKFYLYLISCYRRYISSIEDDLTNPVGTSDLEFDNCIENMKIIKRKLELFIEEDGDKQAGSDTSITLINQNSNRNDININISFEQARESIENMTALTDSEVEEILLRVDELEKIVQSKDRKTKKWENAKGIVKWIADKGVDVGITLLPLLLRINSNT